MSKIIQTFVGERIALVVLGIPKKETYILGSEHYHPKG